MADMVRAELGSVERPFVDPAPRKLARSLLAGRWGEGLRYARGEFWEWYGGQWKKRDKGWVTEATWAAMEDVFVAIGRSGDRVKRLDPRRVLAVEVMEAMAGIVQVPYSQFPVWLGEAEGMDPQHCVALLDRVGCVEGGELRWRDRDQGWFGGVTPVVWDEAAECPTWERCLEQWGRGDKLWAELLERWMGYCLLGTRKYARWMLLHGVIRGGKGTIYRLLEWLVGEDWFWGGSLNDLAARFGLMGLESARVLAISEVQSLDSKDGETASRVIKNALGQDRVMIDVKNQRALTGVRLGCAPMLSANQIPELPNKGAGLSGKMLVLPFKESFLDKEQYDLDKVLREEGPGIVKRLVGAGCRWEGQKDVGRKWPEPESARDTRKVYEMQGNAMQAFLEARFVRRGRVEMTQATEGFVPHEMVQTEFEEWVRQNQVQIRVPRNMLLVKIEQETTWGVYRYRLPEGGKLGLKGLSLRRVIQDMV